MNGLLIAANASTSGKTTAALALAAALQEKNFCVRAAKSGPDYIDAAWLTAITGNPVANLDIWMAQESGALVRILRRMRCVAPDKQLFLLVEGAMGLYDGHRNGGGSCAELAARLDLPVLLLLNVKGMGQSCAALAEGFLNYEPAWQNEFGKPKFCGIICTHCGGLSHQEMLRQALAPVMTKAGVGYLGFLPAKNAPQLPSRHLGLVQAAEYAGKIDKKHLADWFTENCDLEALLRATRLAQKAEQKCPDMANADTKKAAFFPPLINCRASGPRVAIARDKAFSFCYADLPAVLREMGAETVFFSPLSDKRVPDCDAVYIPGGYPELYAKELSQNSAMLAQLASLAADGLPVYGECGGYIYLMRSLIDLDGKTWPMSGLLPLNCVMTSGLAALGYREVCLNKPFCPQDSASKLFCRGHEFHYAVLEQPINPDNSLWLAHGKNGGQSYEGCLMGNTAGSWIHLYPEGSREFWRQWLNCAAKP